jgi:hypothetical protein
MFQPAKPLLLIGALVALVATMQAAPPEVFPALPRDMSAGWNRYVEATQQRIDREVVASPRFLALDFGASAAADRASILAGGMPVSETGSVGPNGRALEVPGAWVHHWRGAVLIPHVTLDQVFSRLQTSVPGSGQGDVLASAILSRDEDSMHVFIKVQRQVSVLMTFTFVYNTEHEVRFTRRDALRGSSVSVATKIAEISGNGTASEREYAAGDDNGFLWRWNSYWRYEQVPAGVIAECESITLSRTPPFGTGLIASRFEKREAPASMTRALINLRSHFADKASVYQTPRASSPARSASH